jgi:hypothetical protein
MARFTVPGLPQGLPLTFLHVVVAGKAPAVVATGGFSGLFPDSSGIAYQFASLASTPGTALYCNVWLTKDGAGICLPNINLDNCTIIKDVFPKGKMTYNVNGVSTTGWFSVDFQSTDLEKVFRECTHRYFTSLEFFWVF